MTTTTTDKEQSMTTTTTTKMKFSADSDLLLAALRTATQFTNKIHSVARNIAMVTGKDSVTIYATNMESFYKETIPADVESPGSVLCEVDLEYLKAITDKVVVREDAGLVSFVGPSMTFTSMKKGSIDDLPQWPTIPMVAEANVTSMKSALSYTIPCVDPHCARENANTIHVHVYDHEASVIGTDGRRMTVYKVFSPTSREFTVSLPLNVAKILRDRVTDRDILTLSLHDATNAGFRYLVVWFHDAYIMTPATSLYPDWKRIITNVKSVGKAEIDAAAFLRAGKTIPIKYLEMFFGKGCVVPLSIKFAQNTMSLSSVSYDDGSVLFHTDIPIVYDGQETTALVNAEFIVALSRLLKKTRSISITAPDDNSPLVFSVSGKDTKFDHYIMPLIK